MNERDWLTDRFEEQRASMTGRRAPMRTTVLCMFALAAVPVARLAGAEPDRVELDLGKFREECVSARNAGDLERAMACWSADARIMIEGRPPIEGPAAREVLRQRFVDKRVVRVMETERIEHSGNLAYELGRITMTLPGPDGQV